ncbi:hypothetical protein [Kitasatospora sp. GP82]|uniref:hypothetical protein n=1 Tax=Kitasatospora sp. GP82 TaxID=3035089 RepID=UPI002475425C|nr:hypothetical protein [Kitasatospora sp. GP82]MDH6129408.1 hypothetical protein [Kitasatospora sp. GP82]
MTAATPSSETLHYAVDLTATDIARIHAFLRGQVLQLDHHPDGSQEQRAASALMSIITDQVAQATIWLETLSEVPRQDDFWTSRLYRLNRAWNCLVEAARPWADQSGYDHRRWRTTDTDPAGALHRHEAEAKRREN